MSRRSASSAVPSMVVPSNPLTAFAPAVLLAAAGTATAQTRIATPETIQPAAAASAAPETMADGEIRRIDAEAGKMTLRHGPLENLKMPAMTMVFRVADRKMLEGLKEGDKVKFIADRIDGDFTVIAIETVKSER